MRTLFRLSSLLPLMLASPARAEKPAPKAKPVVEKQVVVLRGGGEDAATAATRPVLIDTDFNAKLVRPEKVTYFRKKAADLNSRHESLSVEREEVLTAARKKMEDFHAEVAKAGGGGPGDDLTPWVSPYFRERDAQFRKDVADFEKEVNAEIRLKKIQNAEQAQAKAAAVEAAAKLREQEPLNAPPPSATPRPEPVPSSVPGLPPGVEPAKKSAGLPPGITRGKK